MAAAARPQNGREGMTNDGIPAIRPDAEAAVGGNRSG